MSLSEVKTWKGQAYDAIVMVEEWSDAESRLAPTSSAHVCKCIQMTARAVRTAEPPEIEAARTLLTNVVLGLAHSLANRTGEDRVPEPAVRDKIDEFRAAVLLSSAGGGGVNVPLPTDAPPSDLRVYVVHFVNAYGTDDLRAHPAPDPFLLAVRAAVTWSRRNGQPLLAAAEPKDYYEVEGWDELDQLAMEEHEEERERLLRPQSDYDLARSLGQLDRYYGTAGVSAR